MRFLVTIALIAGLLGLAAPAAAEEVVSYKVDGAAPATGDDKADRTKALDEAFKAATRAALDELGAAGGETVDREIVKRARLWVASF